MKKSNISNIILINAILSAFCIIDRSFLSFFNSKYTLDYIEKDFKTDKPILYLVSHRYSIFDVLITTRLFRKLPARNPYVVAVNLPLSTNIVNNIMKYTYGPIPTILEKNIKNRFNILNKKIKEGSDIIIFPTPWLSNTGIYYLLKNNDVSVYNIDIINELDIKNSNTEKQISDFEPHPMLSDITTLIPSLKWFNENKYNFVGQKYNVSVKEVDLYQFMDSEPQEFIKKCLII